MCGHRERQDHFHKRQGQGPSFTKDEEQNRSTLPMPTSARRPSTMSSLTPVEIQQNSMVEQERQQNIGAKTVMMLLF